jgi:branched-chain amino acid transport system permease protein
MREEKGFEMELTGEKLSATAMRFRINIRAWVSQVPLLGWLFGALIAVGLEMAIGTPLARGLGLPKVPVLFGLVIMLKKPLLIPSTLLYLALVYLLPIGLVARLGSAALNRLAAKLVDLSAIFSILIHIALLYLALHLWSGMSDYRVLVVKLTLIAIMVTLSLNVVNGFMALGAYTASVFTVSLFANDKIFGPALLPPAIGPFFFPIALFLGGLAAAIGALAVAVPSFRTRGDYLAIISLAFMFIVKSLIENLEIVGGPRGLGSQPDWANLPTVFLTTVICIWVINNFVRSTLGKALNAVRDNEMAADAMTVNTRRTKITAFLFAAFWAGVAGGLFAHVLRYVNPAMFSIQKLAEVLAMVYFGGLNSVYGAIVGATSISLLGEVLRPLEIFKWIIIPLLLILVMIFRPTGLIAFKEFDVKKLIQPKNRTP